MLANLYNFPNVPGWGTCSDDAFSHSSTCLVVTHVTSAAARRSTRGHNVDGYGRVTHMNAIARAAGMSIEAEVLIALRNARSSHGK